MINKKIESITLLEELVYGKLLEIIDFETKLCPLNHPDFMTETDKEKHNNLMTEYNGLKEKYYNEHNKLGDSELPIVNFDIQLKTRRLEIKGLVPLYTGDEFDNNIRLCYERAYIHGKKAIEGLVGAEKSNNINAEQNVRNRRTYYICIGLCEGYYIGEKTKAYLEDYENKLKNGIPVLEDRVEYEQNIETVKKILLKLAQLRFDGIAFINESTQKEEETNSSELEKECSSLISRCDILATVMPAGTCEVTDLYSLRASMYANPREFIENMSETKEKQKTIV